jgi:hypothetical protein
MASEPNVRGPGELAQSTVAYYQFLLTSNVASPRDLLV